MNSPMKMKIALLASAIVSIPTQVYAQASAPQAEGARYKLVEFKLSVDNLFDKKYVSSVFALTGGSSPFFCPRQLAANLDDRRRAVGSVTVKFGGGE